MNSINKIATRSTIANHFGTGSDVTHRILDNLKWSFFRTHFGDDATAMWEEAHPFNYEGSTFKNYTAFSIDFIQKHLDLFAGTKFQTSAGWKLNKETGKSEWVYRSGYKATK